MSKIGCTQTNLHVSLYHTDYVCVLDIDLLELAITTWKGGDTGKLVSARRLFTYLRFIHIHSPTTKHRSIKMSTLAREKCECTQNIIILFNSKTTNEHGPRVSKYLFCHNEVSL